MTIISAHREPDVFFEYAKSAEEKGFKVNQLQAPVWLPICPSHCGHDTGAGDRGADQRLFERMDALLAITQMPPGIPVATVAINGAMNAGILAVQILAVGDRELKER